MKTTITITLLFLLMQLAYGQNLVLNPSFEEFDTCPYTPGAITYAHGWLNMCNSTLPADYFNSCCTNNYLFSVPYNNIGYQQASTGNAYCALVTYYRIWLYDYPNYREYIGAELDNILNIGQKYFLSLKVSLTDATCASNNIGVLFSTVPYYYNSYDSLTISTTNFAHLNCTSIITDTMYWTTISGSFISDSSYKYIIIGNFFDDNSTNITNYYNSCVAYYYIDDVCVSPDSLMCDLSSIDNNKIPLTNISVFPNPVEDFLYFKGIQDQSYCRVFNLQGKLIKDIGFVKNNVPYSVSEFLPGVYFFRFIEKTNSTNKKVMIINPYT